MPNVTSSKRRLSRWIAPLAASAFMMTAYAPAVLSQSSFQIEEATISEIQAAILDHTITTTDVVEMYLERIAAYNGPCVDQPEGVLGPVTMIPNAGKVNALMTLNLRPESREAWGFDPHYARSMTNLVDDDPDMPDALETAAALDEYFATTGELVGPLHGVVIAIKDQFDTFDMRTTSGADAFWADDRPPDDATFVTRLREAGAIILAKANMDEYAGGEPRSSFGGMECNPYATERRSGGSSGGSAVAVAANLVTCAIGEETGGSIIKPSRWNNIVGLVPTRELVSADGMIQRGINTRVGPMCRTVEDAARILDVYAGYDPADELTAFSYGRMPDSYFEGLSEMSGDGPLAGYRIGVVREYMDKSLFTVVDEETIDIIDQAVSDLAALGATIVDPGPGGALFQSCVDQNLPIWDNQQFIRSFPELFPFDEDGNPMNDHIATLLDMYFDTSLVPRTSSGQPTIRSIGGRDNDVGASRYNFNAYIRERGDAVIQSLTDLYTKANFWDDPNVPNRQGSLERTDQAMTLDTAGHLQSRFAVQTIVYDCFAEMELDAVVYPSGNIPPGLALGAEEPSINGRGSNWTQISGNGFTALTVPAGFTTVMYDRDENGELMPAVPAVLPVGMDILGLPFTERTVFEIGAAFEAATGHRRQPPDFGPLE